MREVQANISRHGRPLGELLPAYGPAVISLVIWKDADEARHCHVPSSDAVICGERV